MDDDSTTPLIVVGVDGSPDADAALHHAAAEARRRHARVLAGVQLFGRLLSHARLLGPLTP